MRVKTMMDVLLNHGLASLQYKKLCPSVHGSVHWSIRGYVIFVSKSEKLRIQITAVVGVRKGGSKCKGDVLAYPLVRDDITTSLYFFLGKVY